MHTVFSPFSVHIYCTFPFGFFISGGNEAESMLVFWSSCWAGYFSFLLLYLQRKAHRLYCVHSHRAVRSKHNFRLLWKSRNSIRALMCLRRKPINSFPAFQLKQQLILVLFESGNRRLIRSFCEICNLFRLFFLYCLYKFILFLLPQPGHLELPDWLVFNFYHSILYIFINNICINTLFLS